jgi:uncharacterized protein YvpB
MNTSGKTVNPIRKIHWAILIFASILIGAGLLSVYGLMSAHFFAPQTVFAAEERLGVIQSPQTPTDVFGLPVTGVSTATATPFQPGPSSTPTPRFSPTPTATLTPTLTSTPTQTLPPTQTETPLPTATPWPPDSALIDAIIGYHQIYVLDCESRAAVDWARYFGYEIDENEFLFGLPTSDDPDIGFVGNVNDPGGMIPPNSYGVHAGPISARLRSYGVNAMEKFGVSMDELKNEIASGRPVVIWIIFGTVPGPSMTYVSQAGRSVLVAPNEHAAILIGYDSNGVTILDNETRYWRSWDTFQQSFGALGNMAVFYNPD